MSAQSGRTTDPFVFESTSIIRQHFLSLIIHSANKTNERHAWLVLSLILVNTQRLRDWCAKGRTLSHIIIKLNTVSYIFDELRNLAKKDKNLLRYNGSSIQLKTKYGRWPNCTVNQSLNRRALKVDYFGLVTIRSVGRLVVVKEEKEWFKMFVWNWHCLLWRPF